MSETHGADSQGTRERDIIRAFVDLSNELVDEYDVVDMLARLTDNCAGLLNVASAGLLLADARGVLHLVASSSERAHHLEVFQLQRDEGPCLDCFHSREVVVVPDLAAEEAALAALRAGRSRRRVPGRTRAPDAPARRRPRHARTLR